MARLGHGQAVTKWRGSGKPRSPGPSDGTGHPKATPDPVSLASPPAPLMAWSGHGQVPGRPDLAMLINRLIV